MFDKKYLESVFNSNKEEIMEAVEYGCCLEVFLCSVEAFLNKELEVEESNWIIENFDLGEMISDVIASE